MTTLPITASEPAIRLLGRMDRTARPPALDWTGSGFEVQFRGSELWAELEAPAVSPVFWVIVLADGQPFSRFPVEPGVRFYPLAIGMEPAESRRITLLKETQCMPAQPEATVLARSLRLDGELLPLPPYTRKIEFIGDSLTSGEGALAPRNNPEWITAWFTARGNYSWYACEALHAERRILSQSGWGVCWDYQHNEQGNLSDGYELNVGVLKGPEAEARGCRLPNDFGSWQPDAVCIRLLSNDAGGMKARGSYPEDRETVVSGCLALIRKVRRLNPGAKIVWILPGSDCWPDIGREAADRALREGLEHVYAFGLPDYTEADYGARAHPNAEWNRKAGGLLADFLRTIL